MTAPTPTVALLGTGIMGTGMARSIRAAGLPLQVWNRSRDRAEPLAETGAVITDTPVEAVTGADLVVTMLHDADAVAAVMAEAADAIAESVWWVQSSTVGIEGNDRLAALAADHRIGYVDAPVLGTKKPADEGTLVILASGPDEARERVEPLFAAVGSRTMWMGEAGSGSRLKLAVNAWVGALTVATAQSVSMAEALGLDPALFLSAIAGGATDSPYAHLKGAAMISGDYTPSFTASGAAKDAGLIAAAARSAGIDPTLADAVRERFDAAVHAGHGAEDMAAAYFAFRPSPRP